MSICSINGCERKSISKGMCGAHYTKEYARTHPEWLAKNKAEQKAAYPVYCKTPRARFNQFVSSARRSNRKILISFEQFCELRNLPCHYCGGELPKTGGGLDRKDSRGDYTIDNIVSCCWPCNDTKGDKLSYEEMLNLVAFRHETLAASQMVGAC